MEKTCVVVWAPTCEMEDISELEILMVSAITRLNDYGVLIGREESRGKNRRISFLWLRGEVLTLLERKLLGLQIEKSQNRLETVNGCVVIVWLCNLRLEQEMRNLASGYQWILLVETSLILRRVENKKFSKKNVTIKRRNSLKNSIEALILLNEEHWGLLRLQAPLGWKWGDSVRRKRWGYLQERRLWSKFLLVDCYGWMIGWKILVLP